MIERLKKNNLLDVYDFIKKTKDINQDFYITDEKQRKFLDNFDLIEKILKNQEAYGLFEKELKGILLIYREKGFRTYLKILAENRKIENDLIRFFVWNCGNTDIYMKLKKRNSFIRCALDAGFKLIGSRGIEFLLFRKGMKLEYITNYKDTEETGE